MYGRITLYSNTGFNGVDIPADQSVLESSDINKYFLQDWYYMREDLDKPSIRVKLNYEACQDVDYVKLETQSTPGSGTPAVRFYFAIPRAVTAGVTELALDLDALLTMGGAANVTYLSGWQERGHISKQEDQLFTNTYAESWQPVRPLECTEVTTIESDKTDPGDNRDVVVTNIDLASMGGTADETELIEGLSTGGNEALIPRLRIPDFHHSTFFSIWDDDEEPLDPTAPRGANKDFLTPGTAAYEYKNQNVQNALGKLFSFGQLQLQASYRIPYMYIDEGKTQLDSTTGLYDRIAGYHQVWAASMCPYEYTIPGYTVKNKKCFDTYRSYVLVNLGSGDMSTKSPHEIYNFDTPTTYPSVRIWADPTSTGKPYARFHFINSNPLQWSETVKGLQWANNQISMEGASGSVWNSINSAFTSQSLSRQMQQAKMNNQYAEEQENIARSAGSLQNQFAEEMFNRNYFYTGVGAIGQSIGQGAGAIVGGISGAGMVAGGEPGAGAAMMTRSAMNALGSLTTGLEAGRKMDEMALNFAAQQAQYRADVDMNASKSYQRAENAEFEMQALQQKVNENQVGLIKQNGVVAPYVSFTPEQNLGLYGYNKFAIYEIRKSDEDLKMEDAYYQRFGYNGIHRPLTSACFNARQYYTYVQAFNINIDSPYGMRIRQKGIAQLNSGVRVWKVRPNPSYYETN